MTISTTEAARRLGRTPKTVREYCRRGLIAATRLTERSPWEIDLDRFNTWLAASRTER